MTQSTPTLPTPLRTRLGRLAPWLLALLAVAYVLWAAWPMQMAEDGFDFHAAAALPVLEGGRVKPLDSVARTHLMAVSGQQSFVDDTGRRQPAIVWLLDVLAGTEAALRHRVYRIDHPQLLSMLDLSPRDDSPAGRTHRYRFSLAEIGPHWQTIVDQADRAERIPEADRDPLDRRLVELGEHLQTFIALDEGERIAIPAPIEHAGGGGIPAEKQGVAFQPLGQTPHHGMMMTLDDAPGPPAIQTLLTAYQMRDPATFNSTVARQLAFSHTRMAQDTRRSAVEAAFNHAAPFHRASVLYAVAFVLLAIGWLAAAAWPPRAALLLTLIAFALHTGAIGARMWLEGRPPVTNLYASAVFVGWGCVLLGLILHTFAGRRSGDPASPVIRSLSLSVAAVTGFATLLIAHQLAQGGDTLEPVRAVLDANFFMATHVTTVTLGYTAMFVAGFLGIAFVLAATFSRQFAQPQQQRVGRMIYGVTCFALLLSFTGTTLGGVWADQAWGRFWGWDPKENGALLIVLCCALMLHARWAGLIGPRGMALIAVFGNIVTAWAWFGVNELGVGLHSYGFTEGTAATLLLFVASQLLIIALGATPARLWRSTT